MMYCGCCHGGDLKTKMTVLPVHIFGTGGKLKYLNSVPALLEGLGSHHDRLLKLGPVGKPLSQRDESCV